MIRKRVLAFITFMCLALCALPAVSAAGAPATGDPGVPTWIFFVLGGAVVVILALILIQKFTKK